VSGLGYGAGATDVICHTAKEYRPRCTIKVSRDLQPHCAEGN
jgi:hypothetical protein